MEEEPKKDDYKEMKMDKIIFDRLLHISNDIHTIKTIQGKGNLLLISIVFVCATVFGMSDEVWTPHVETIITMFKTIPIKGA